jgi:hypothetical protein
LVLRDAAASTEVVAAHRTACVCFSAVTVAFHVFFGVWMIAGLTQPYFAPLSLVLLAALYLAARAGNGWSIGAAVLVLLASCCLFAWGVNMREMPYLRDALPRQPLRDLWGVALVSTFGFLLCPYLDLTFHRARQHTSRTGGRLAFGVGFGVFFLVMILFTLAYSGWLQQLMARTEGLPPVVAALIGFHMLVQAAQTTALHARETVTRPLAAALLLAAIIAAATASNWVLPARTWERGYDLGEGMYRSFMGFYALVFPTYVWLCMIGSARRRPSRRSLVAFAAVVIVASPLFALGFVWSQMLWVIPGMAIVLLGRLAVPKPFKWSA